MLESKPRSLRGQHLISIISVLLCLSLFAGTGWAAEEYLTDRLPSKGMKATCEIGPIIDPENHQWEIGRLGTFSGRAAESLSVSVGSTRADSRGLNTTDLQIVGLVGRHYIDGLGETVFWLDSSRPVKSHLQEKQPGKAFPARQVMRFHFLFETEALPGRLFRTLRPAVLSSDDVTSFPPSRGTTYYLQEPVELEDVDDPGEVVVRVRNTYFRVGHSRMH